MNCPNCNREIKNGNICDGCGVDVVLFDKTIKISDVLYNKGLNLAKINDLSGAEEALNKSIQFNKNNYYARNLLGLVYYEIGRIGDALKQWVISSSLMEKSNPSIKYIEEIQNDPKQLDLYNDAINMYNGALAYIEQKSDDMALIQLKKAIELSPKFIDAMNLLAFCYLIQNETQQASILVNKVLEIDTNNPIALNYYNEIYPSRQKPKPMVKKEVIKQPVQVQNVAASAMLTPEKRRRLLGDNFYFAEIVSFIVGGVCVAALFFTLIMPGVSQDQRKTIAALEAKVAEADGVYIEKQNELQGEIGRLKEEKEKLESENSRLNAQFSLQDKLNKLADASALSKAGNHTEAASIIYSIDAEGLPEEKVEEYNSIKSKSYVEAALSNYNNGLDKFNAGSYEEAKRFFEGYFLYASPDGDLVDDATYFLGRISEAENDMDRAKEYYNTILEKYPNSNRAKSAKTRLNEIG